MIYFLGCEESKDGRKIALHYSEESSVSKTTFYADVLKGEFMEYMYAISTEFKKYCKLGNGVNYALSGFKVRDIDNGSRQEIQFIVNIRTGWSSFDNAKTNWKEMRDMPLQEGSDYNEQILAMNAIVATFNQFQEYVRENIAEWLKLGDEYANQLSIFDRREDVAIPKQSNPRQAFKDTLKKIAKDGNVTITAYADGEEIGHISAND